MEATEIPSACMRSGIRACRRPFPACSRVVAAVMVQIRAREEFTIESMMWGGWREGQQDREQVPPKIKSRSGAYDGLWLVGMSGRGARHARGCTQEPIGSAVLSGSWRKDKSR